MGSATLGFFVIFLAALFFSEISSKVKLPWVISLIIAGIVIGPHGFKILEVNETITFIGDLGLVFLMFMAGLETKLSTFKENRKQIFWFALGGGLIPFLTGLSIGFLFGLSTSVSLLLGIIFISSSIAVVIPSMQANKLLRLNVGKVAIAGTIIIDVISLILLSFILQSANPITNLPLPIFYLLLIISLVTLRWAIPKLEETFAKRGRDLFEHELHVVFTILIGTVVFFELLGLHQITAGFFAGFVLSETMQSKRVKEKIHAIAYGVFIPVFFVIVGANTDISVIFKASNALILTTTLVVASILSKFIGGFIGGKLGGFDNNRSALLGAAGIPRLSTTLAVVFAGSKLGLVNETTVFAMIILSIVTTLIAPIGIKVLGGRVV